MFVFCICISLEVVVKYALCNELWINFTTLSINEELNPDVDPYFRQFLVIRYKTIYIYIIKYYLGLSVIEYLRSLVYL